MELDIRPGKYVIAVSGGVDSMVLLDMLARNTAIIDGYRLVVAHFDHGMRSNSDEDRQFVQRAANQYGLPFVYNRVELGARASEAQARSARYTFLQRVQAAVRADAIITAHHKDDVLETAVLNLLRGTGRRGLSSLHHNPNVVRPLLNTTKADIYSYARQRQLAWVEDETNQDQRYRRNFVRQSIIPKFSSHQHQQLHQHIAAAHQLNHDIEVLISELLDNEHAPHLLKRMKCIHLPHIVSKELVASWLRRNQVRDFEKHTIERLTIAIKTAAPGTKHHIKAGAHIFMQPNGLVRLVQ